MGQVRTDTFAQLEAKRRVAESRRCPSCDRRAALSSPREFVDEFDGTPCGRVRECLYCGHEVGTLLGRSFGRRSSDFLTLADCERALLDDGEIEESDS